MTPHAGHDVRRRFDRRIIRGWRRALLRELHHQCIALLPGADNVNAVAGGGPRAEEDGGDHRTVEGDRRGRPFEGQPAPERHPFRAGPCNDRFEAPDPAHRPGGNLDDGIGRRVARLRFRRRPHTERQLPGCGRRAGGRASTDPQNLRARPQIRQRNAGAVHRRASTLPGGRQRLHVTNRPHDATLIVLDNRLQRHG
jgi:hypothetical protein